MTIPELPPNILEHLVKTTPRVFAAYCTSFERKTYIPVQVIVRFPLSTGVLCRDKDGKLLSLSPNHLEPIHPDQLKEVESLFN